MATPCDDVRPSPLAADALACGTIASWVARAATAGEPGERLLQGFAARLVEAGLPLFGVLVAMQSLHPLLHGRGFLWRRAEGVAAVEEFLRLPSADGEPAGWRQSPFSALYEGSAPSIRFRLEGHAPLGFGVLQELRAQGATDYVAFKTPFGDQIAGEGILTSWTTDRPGGFTAADITALEGLLPSLEVAMKAAHASWTSASLLKTYLGPDVARWVMAGEVVRGVAQRLDAVIWWSDLAGFTRLSGREPQARVIDLLNAAAERAVQAIEAEGGHVQKFIGDGVLATFDLEHRADATRAALNAADQALAACDDLASMRECLGLPTTRLRVALHRGAVFYGNVGARSRLDFTVIGPAVNVAARLCDLAGSLGWDLVVSEAFHRSAPTERQRLVGLGRFALRGIRRPQTLYTLERDPRGGRG